MDIEKIAEKTKKNYEASFSETSIKDLVKKHKKKSTYLKYIITTWGIFFFGVLSIIILFSGAALGLYGPMPDLQQLENPRTNLATQIISSDDVILGKYYFDDNRTPILFDEI